MKKVSLEEVLAYREKKVLRRRELMSEYPFPLACLSLNIPGEYKDFSWARRAFREEVKSFTLALEAEGLAAGHSEHEEESAGYTAYISVDIAADVLKTIALRIEETHPLGRLFDMDIYESDINTPGGRKLSREDSGKAARPCLVCGGDAFVCGRSRAHSPEELRGAVHEIMEAWLRLKLGDKICSAALWAMMSEVAVTPKPGLVDRANNGAHRDMDFFTFIDSAQALLPWFRSCALAGFDSESCGTEGSGTPTSPASLFEALRPPGRIAEVLMKKASGGVNVHRGYIFSLGILSAAYGKLYRDAENPDPAAILEFSKAMTKNLMEDFSCCSGEASHGETIYAQSGIPGIRGEVSRGFPSVTEYALPQLRRLLEEGHSLNDAGSAVLLILMAHAEDTNILHRGGIDALRSIQKALRSFFAANPDMETIRTEAAALDDEFISRNLSPGGSADLLGVTFFLYRIFESGASLN